ncbi:lytic polysaccharide monooxygenase [Enterobacter asburiae]|uniref:lytic polysaccharide monooxygenase n=1 Tax=Scandinavium sp. UTDF21-P1B TaxID=3446379 RepID=UPI00346C6FCD
MRINKIAIAVASLLVSTAAWSHGYVMEPASRGYMCTPGMGQQNQDCGAGPMYEPQSIEGTDGFPQVNAGPADGKLASAGLHSMGKLDEQSSTRWAKHPISAGEHSFTWKYTAAHVTKDWRYFITKADWNPEKPLTRASFEATPFCTIDGKMQTAIPGGGTGVGTAHKCNVPQREGYQVIMAAWDVGDTAATFYNVIDVDFGGQNHPGEDVPEPKPPVDDVIPPNDDVTPPGDETHAAPVINLLQDHIVVQKKSYNEGYAMNASSTTGADKFTWEVVEGYGNFQLQEKQAAPTHGKLEGKDLHTVRAWVKAGTTGKAKYRLTASNSHGQAVKFITIEVKDTDNGGSQQPSANAFTPGKVYAIGDVVSYKGHTYRCLNAHTGAAHWNPAEAHSLWQLVK